MSDAAPEAVGNAFTKKLGPLPGWGWVLIAVGGAYGIYYVHKNGLPSILGGSTPVVQAVAPTNGIDSYPGGTPIPQDNSAGTTSTPNGVASPSTNAQWTKIAAEWLVGTQNYDPTTVSNALAKYANGTGELNSQEQAIVSAAIRQFGQPPGGVLPIAAAPPPATTIQYWGRDHNGVVYKQMSDGTRVGVTKAEFIAAGLPDYSGHDTYTTPNAPVPVVPVHPVTTPAPAPAPASRSYTVRPGDNLSAIATRYYGSPNWQKIYSANSGTIGGNPNLIRPGQVLVIP